MCNIWAYKTILKMKTKNVNKKMDGPVNLERKKNAAAENLFFFLRH